MSETVTIRDERRQDLWRSLGLTFLLVSPAVLIVGNQFVPELPGRSFTPFEIAGPAFLFAVLPLYGVLVFRGAWRTGLAVVLVYVIGLIVLTGLWVGAPAAALIGLTDIVVAALIVVAWKHEQRPTV